LIFEKTEDHKDWDAVDTEHLWKPFWKRVNRLVKDNDGAQHRFVMRNDRRRPHSRTDWDHTNHDVDSVDSVIGSDVLCRARVDELKIVVIDRPISIITEGVEVIFLLTDTVEIDDMCHDGYTGVVIGRLEGIPDMSVKIRVVSVIIVPVINLRFSLSHENTVTVRER
jgi:hypothetical protein